ncbi:flagellar motor switch protein FliM [Candidatus Tenderia electrophaga]|jgi:flagellar motor switch protein FliM|uniref:Flagellar motor switch protein FliM n=1 Tax=Candidatus Tenderia electrophaga TaxID=1748243 RepID=A0A0S2TC38_9GAMM|nr:flagellar motor switch protein FliM [Candidatus Tenderia electrophaga]
MSVNDLLSQDEIDALLHGVDGGDVETEEDIFDGEAKAYDFTSQDRIVRGRMPTLEMINERFARYFRTSLFNMLRRTAEIAVGGVQMLKFAEYVHTLFVPTSLNLVHVKPLRGTGLFVFDPKFVFIVVDNFFGGSGKFYNKIEGREFTHTENRIIEMMLQKAFQNMKDAWAPVMDVDFEFQNSEVNPHFANIVSPTEVVVISTFHIELDGGGGDIHVTIPYSMLEPIRELLDAGTVSDRTEVDERWTRALMEDIKEANIDVKSTLTEVDMSLREVLNMKAGDIIPFDFPERVILATEDDVPVFRGKFGVHHSNNAIRIIEPIKAGLPVVTKPGVDR